jgi:catechol 2,3-dioxygenase-like lactoylglutathione lyase family enzyme
MIDHTSINVKDYAQAKELFLKTLAPLGYGVMMDLPEYKTAGFGDGKPDFWISEKKESTAGTHVAFEAKDKEQVDSFYKAALEAGAIDNGAPGYRAEYTPGYYAAFVHDFDGNNIEAVWMDPLMQAKQ